MLRYLLTAGPSSILAMVFSVPSTESLILLVTVPAIGDDSQTAKSPSRPLFLSDLDGVGSRGDEMAGGCSFRASSASKPCGLGIDALDAGSTFEDDCSSPYTLFRNASTMARTTVASVNSTSSFAGSILVS